LSLRASAGFSWRRRLRGGTVGGRFTERAAKRGAICLSVLIPLLPIMLPAQAPSADEPAAETALAEQRHKHHPEIARVVDLADSAPPEFSAHFLLQVATSAQLHDRKWQKELLEQAFERANLATEPARRRSFRDGDLFDVTRTRAEMISRGFDEVLDRLSLQSLAVKAMLPLDRARAIDMFQSITYPRLEPKPCGEALVDDVSDYYAVLGQIVNSGFSARQRRDGQHVALLNHALSRVDSAIELAPVAEVLSAAVLSKEDKASLAGSFALALERVQHDDRSFTASLGGLNKQFHQLAQTLRGIGVVADPVIAAYRKYLVANLTGSRCADNVEQPNAAIKEAPGKVLDAFNLDLASGTNPSLAPLRIGEIKPERIDGRANAEPFIDAADQEVLGRFIEFLMADDKSGGEEKNTVRWRSQFDDFLRQIDEIKPGAGEPEYRYLYRKANALTALLEAAPPGPGRDQLLRQLIAFLSSSNMEQESPIEWFAQVSVTSDTIGDHGSEEYQVFLRELEHSGNSLLALYALAASALPLNP
jgi:hypothetical protein